MTESKNKTRINANSKSVKVNKDIKNKSDIKSNNRNKTVNKNTTIKKEVVRNYDSISTEKNKNITIKKNSNVKSDNKGKIVNKNTEIKNINVKNVKVKKKSSKVVNIVSKVFSIIFLIAMVVIFGIVVYLDVLPIKYFIPFTIIFGIISFFIFFLLFDGKIKRTIKYIFMFVSLIFVGISIFISYYAYETVNFFEEVNNHEVSTKENYYVMVKNDSEYESVKELSLVRVGTFNENTSVYKEAFDKLSSESDVTYIEYSSSHMMIEDLLLGEIPVILVSNLHKNQYEEEKGSIDDKTKILEKIEVETKNSTEEVITIKPASEDVMTIFISGIDTYGSINLRSRSDVNMLVTINTKTHEVLLISIPRDYYVQLHDKPGYKDKLTHAGIYGVNTSIQTVQDFLDIDINYYVRVNFNTLIKVVDVIGGIDVYSDKAFTPWTDNTVYIKKGMNHMNGKQALAFARERYAYEEGDIHRVQNQQDVITAIIKKLTSSKTLLTKYSSLLKSVSSSFQTNVNMDEITELVKLQLDKMPSWNIKKYNLNGTSSMGYTYSMGEQALYVMIPDDTTIKLASSYINGMTKGKSLKELGFN